MTITLEYISPLIGSRFMAQTSEGQVELVLTEAKELNRRGLPAAFRTPLSLIFRGPETVILNQDNYQISHPELGSHIWCLAPILPEMTASASGLPVTPDYEVLFG
ncbi:MAG: hypothetical protein V4525_10140 [Pseudomonadota bacterium]